MLPEAGEPTILRRFVISVTGQALELYLQTDLEPLPHFLKPAGIIISAQTESSELKKEFIGSLYTQIFLEDFHV